MKYRIIFKKQRVLSDQITGCPYWKEKQYEKFEAYTWKTFFLRCKMQLKCKQVGWNGYLFDEYLLR